MRFIRRKLKFFGSVLLLVLALWGGYALNDRINGRKAAPAFHTIDQVVNPVQTYNKMLVSEAIISGVRSDKKLIVMEAEVSTDVIFDDSYLDWEIFSKTQKITYYAEGSFTVDLSAFDAGDFTVDYENRRITVEITGPDLNSLDILDEKTQYHDTDRGWLRFGDIKLNPMAYDIMVAYAKEQMREQLLGSQITMEAGAMAVQAVKDIIEAVINGVYPLETYEIIVKIKGTAA